MMLFKKYKHAAFEINIRHFTLPVIFLSIKIITQYKRLNKNVFQRLLKSILSCSDTYLYPLKRFIDNNQNIQLYL